MAEKIRLRIGNLGNAVLVTGQAYQDPKDALHEFVSNAADEYAEAGTPGERIRVILHRKGKYPVIAIEDFGRGLSPGRLRGVARNLFESSKAGDPRTLGEKAIGILAFQQLAGRCDIVSRAAGSAETWTLRLQRGSPSAELAKADRRRVRETAGTTVYLSDLDPDVLRVLTQRKVVDYLRRRRGPALARGEYTIEVVERKHTELVLAEEHDGIHLDIPARNTLFGRLEFSLYVAPSSDQRRRVAVAGRGSTTILDDISELDEFSGEPWTSDQVSGLIAFDALQQSAGRRAILRDREAFPVFVDAVRSIEPAVGKAIEQVAREVDAESSDRLAETLRRIFGKVLKELEDVDNPMRTAVGVVEGEGGLLAEQPDSAEPSLRESTPDIPDDVVPPPTDPEREAPEPPPPGDRSRSRNLPTVLADPNPDGVRSRFAPEERIVYYNDRHPDYLLVKPDEPALLEYLTMLVAKELVVYNNPRTPPNELGEEMVRMLVRVRRHMPRKR